MLLLYSQRKTRSLIGQQALCSNPYWTAKRRIGPGNRKPTSVEKQKGRQNILRKFWFFNESFTLDEIKELENISVPTAAVKEDTNMLSSEFREGFGPGL